MARFLARHPEGDDSARDSRRVVDLLSETGGHVVAHWYAADPALSEPDWFACFAAGMGFPPPASWDERRPAPPARASLGARAGSRTARPVRTLVLTAPSSPLYAETADSLIGLGAAHLALTGAGHRVQDDPRTAPLLREHWRRLR